MNSSDVENINLLNQVQLQHLDQEIALLSQQRDMQLANLLENSEMAQDLTVVNVASGLRPTVSSGVSASKSRSARFKSSENCFEGGAKSSNQGTNEKDS